MRVALLDEGGHALASDPRSRRASAKSRASVSQVRRLIALEGQVQRLLRGGQGKRALRGERSARARSRPGSSSSGSVNGVHEPMGERLLDVRRSGRSGRAPSRYPTVVVRARRWRSAPAGDDPEVRPRAGRACARRRREPDVAGERQLAPPAEREPVDRRDRRLRHGLEQLAASVTELAPVRAPRGRSGRACT